MVLLQWVVGISLWTAVGTAITWLILKHCHACGRKAQRTEQPAAQPDPEEKEILAMLVRA